MVEEGGSDVIKMSQQSEKTPSQLVVPHLSTNLFITIFILGRMLELWQ